MARREPIAEPGATEQERANAILAKRAFLMGEFTGITIDFLFSRATVVPFSFLPRAT